MNEVGSMNNPKLDERLLWVAAIQRTLCAYNQGQISRFIRNVQTLPVCDHSRCAVALEIFDRVQFASYIDPDWSAVKDIVGTL